jgi:hypothetical protein
LIVEDIIRNGHRWACRCQLGAFADSRRVLWTNNR